MALKKKVGSRRRSAPGRRRIKSADVPPGLSDADLRREMCQMTFYAVCRIIEAGEDDPARLQRIRQQKAALEKKFGYEPDHDAAVHVRTAECRQLRRSLHNAVERMQAFHEGRPVPARYNMKFVG